MTLEYLVHPKTPILPIQSRLGRVGSIQAFDPWDSRKSIPHAQPEIRAFATWIQEYIDRKALA